MKNTNTKKRQHQYTQQKKLATKKLNNKKTHTHNTKTEEKQRNKKLGKQKPGKPCTQKKTQNGWKQFLHNTQKNSFKTKLEK